MVAIKKVEFKKLKRLENLTIEFQDSGVTALIGENGIGKSTVLHALACLYKPDEYRQVRKGDDGKWWTDFFVPHTGNIWGGSELAVEFQNATKVVKYEKLERWKPRKNDRKERYTKYIGLLDCTPHIERETEKSRFSFSLENLPLSDAKSRELLKDARHILNRRYSEFKVAKKGKGLKTFLHATVSEGSPQQNSSYTSHYMGAGEYKVLHILENVIRAPTGALIVIEELEVSLHDAVIRRLIPWLVNKANENRLQIVFSTHWPFILDFEKEVEIKSLQSSSNGVVCLNGCKPATMYDITGNQADLKKIICLG